MRALAIVLLCSLGCRTSPETHGPATPTSPPATDAPAEETSTYVSGAKAGPPPTQTRDPALETDAAEAQKVAAVTGLTAKVDTTAAARELAVAAADLVFGHCGAWSGEQQDLSKRRRS